MRLFVTRIPEPTRELSRSETIWELRKAMMGMQAAKDKAAVRRLRKVIKKLEAEEKEDAERSV